MSSNNTVTTSSSSTSTPTDNGSTSTITSTSSFSQSTSTFTTPSSTSIVPSTTSTTTVPLTSTATPTTLISEITSTITQTPSSGGSSTNNFVTTITSTQAIVTETPTASSASTVRSSSSSTPTAISPSSHNSSSGLGTGGTVAIAVVIPIVAVVAAVLLGLWFWRKRKEKRNNQEMRKEEMAQYGYNPNNDPTLPVGAAYTDGGSEAADESGYRGWGATSSNTRKPSTTLGSNSRAAAMGAPGGGAYSDTNSQPGGYGYQSGPSNGHGSGSDGPLYDGAAGAAAAGGIGMAMSGNNRDNRNSTTGGLDSHGINRGPSNASSAYSAAGGRAHSEASSDIPAVPNGYYHEEAPYNIYNDVAPGHGPYGEGPYGGQDAQPVIRDVAARRNTRIERAPTMPQTQGGIAQNF